MNITHEDAALLTRITKGLTDNLKATTGADAEEKFNKAVTAGDIARLVTRKLSLKFNARSKNARKLAQATMSMNSAALAPLVRAFGEDTLVKALPQEAASQHVIDLCEELGAKDIADLCRKKIAQGSAATPAAKPAKPSV